MLEKRSSSNGGFVGHHRVTVEYKVMRHSSVADSNLMRQEAGSNGTDGMSIRVISDLLHYRFMFAAIKKYVVTPGAAVVSVVENP